MELTHDHYRCAAMAINPDPKPGRWILPLVVLGMVAFTYFFVRALPSGSEEGATDTTIAASDSANAPNALRASTSAPAPEAPVE